MKFVLLHHTGIAEPHFDFMFEKRAGDPLRTFRIASWPMELQSEQLATELPDHRSEYLTYEGPVSGNRGEVKRVTAGEVTASEDKGRIQCRITLASPAVPTLEFEFQKSSGAEWLIRRLK